MINKQPEQFGCIDRGYRQKGREEPDDQRVNASRNCRKSRFKRKMKSAVENVFFEIIYQKRKYDREDEFIYQA